MQVAATAWGSPLGRVAAGVALAASASPASPRTLRGTLILCDKVHDRCMQCPVQWQEGQDVGPYVGVRQGVRAGAWPCGWSDQRWFICEGVSQPDKECRRQAIMYGQCADMPEVRAVSKYLRSVVFDAAYPKRILSQVHYCKRNVLNVCLQECPARWNVESNVCAF